MRIVYGFLAGAPDVGEGGFLGTGVPIGAAVLGAFFAEVPIGAAIDGAFLAEELR